MDNFNNLKRVRDGLIHSAEVTSHLPTEEVHGLLKKYMRLHLDKSKRPPPTLRKTLLTSATRSPGRAAERKSRSVLSHDADCFSPTPKSRHKLPGAVATQTQIYSAEVPAWLRSESNFSSRVVCAPRISRLKGLAARLVGPLAIDSSPTAALLVLLQQIQSEREKPWRSAGPVEPISDRAIRSLQHGSHIAAR